MAGMAVIRILTQGYIARAEQIKLEWLGDDEEKLQEGQKPSDVWVTRYGQEVIGAVVVDWLQVKEGGKKLQGQIKGYAVRMRYRGKGVGSALLEEVVQEARKKGVAQGDVVFAEDHASEFSFDLISLLMLVGGIELTCRDANRFPPRSACSLQQTHGQARCSESRAFGFAADGFRDFECDDVQRIDDDDDRSEGEEVIIDQEKRIEGVVDNM